MRPLRTLGRFRSLLTRYLRPQWPRMILLARSCRHDRGAGGHAAGGEPLHRSSRLGWSGAGLIFLALLTIGLALVGQGWPSPKPMWPRT